MLLKKPFKFGLSPNQPAFSTESELWSAPLPTTRHAFNGASGAGGIDVSITYGDYFAAARDFLIQDNFGLLRRAAGRMTDGPVTSADIKQVGVYLLKHGAFYHPSCVILSVFQRRLALVLNVAVSADGQKMLPREYDCLSRLNEAHSAPPWPAAYGRGEGQTGGGRHLPMFLGQWFSGYYEFHLTRGVPAGELAVAVWDTDNGNRILRGQPVLDLIRKMAVLLTYAYNPLTFEAILDWHHGAGDFVVQTAGNQVDVRLITVRNYAPLVRSPDPDLEAVLDGLLLFLVSISLRLRLDRLDGIGAPAVYPGVVVPAICEGFRQGLKMSIASRGLPEDFIPALGAYCGAHKAEQLSPLVDAVMANYPPASDEGLVLKALADDHSAILARSLALPDMA